MSTEVMPQSNSESPGNPEQQRNYTFSSIKKLHGLVGWRNFLTNFEADPLAAFHSVKEIEKEIHLTPKVRGRFFSTLIGMQLLAGDAEKLFTTKTDITDDIALTHRLNIHQRLMSFFIGSKEYREKAQFNSSPIEGLLQAFYFELQREDVSVLISPRFIINRKPLAKRRRIYRRKQAGNDKRPFEYAVSPYEPEVGKAYAHPSRRLLTEKHDFEPLILSLYLLSRIEEAIPGSVLKKKIGHLIGIEPHDFAFSMIQVLHELELLYDPRFAHLAEACREYIFDEQRAKKVTELRAILLGIKSMYPYSLSDDTAFWAGAGSAKRKAFKQAKKPVVVPVPPAEKLSENQPSLSPIYDWNHAMSVMEQIRRELEKLRPKPFLSRYVLNQRLSMSDDNEKVIDDLLENRLKKIEGLSTTSTNMVKQVRQKYSRQYSLETRGKTESVTVDRNQFALQLKVLLSFFAQDQNLSPKAKSWLRQFLNTNTSYLSSDIQKIYLLPIEQLLNEPLFLWLHTLNTPEELARFLTVAKSQPAELSLLLKLMFHRIMELTILHKENRFLFQPVEQLNSHQGQELIDLLQKLHIQPQKVPTEWEAVKVAVPEMDDQTEDILTYTHLKEMRRQIRLWKTRHLFRNLRIPYSVHGVSTVFVAGSLAFGAGAGALAEGVKLLIEYNQAKDEAEKQVALAHQTLPPMQRDVLPGSVDRESLDNRQPVEYAEILHLPEQMQTKEGEELFLFPEIVEDDMRLSSVVSSEYQEMANITFIDSMTEYTYQAAPDELVYKLSAIPNTGAIFPPVGYYFSQVFSLGGQTPWQSVYGQLIWQNGDVTKLPPQEIILVAKPLQKVNQQPGSTSSRVQIFDVNTHFVPSVVYPNPDPDAAQEYVNQLEIGDTELRQLFTDVVTEVRAWYQQPTKSAEELSEIITRFSSKYTDYIAKTRGYSLTLLNEKQFSLDTNLKFFEVVEENPELAFYCDVASRAFKDFGQAFEMNPTRVSGVPTYLVDGDAWSDVGHAWNYWLLPNGQLMVVDSTPPPVDGVTSPEDIKLLKHRLPKEPFDPFEALKDDLESVAKAAALPMKAFSSLLLLSAGLSIYDRVRVARRYIKINRFLNEETDLSESEKKILIVFATRLSQLELTDRQLFVGQAQEEIGLLLQNDLEKYGDFVIWLSEVMALFPKHNKLLAEQGSNQVETDWKARLAQFDHLFSPEELDQLEQVLNGSQELATLPPELKSLFELTVFIQRDWVDKMLAEVQTLANQTPTFQNKFERHVTLLEKQKMVRTVAYQTIKSGQHTKNQHDYLAFLVQANKKMSL